MAERKHSEIGERLKRARKRMTPKCTQDVIAGVCGVTRNTWSRYERGELPPTAEVLKLFCQWTGASADWLLMGEIERKSVPPRDIIFELGSRVRTLGYDNPGYLGSDLWSIAVAEHVLELVKKGMSDQAAMQSVLRELINISHKAASGLVVLEKMMGELGQYES